jgi:hypothetical protein
METQRLEVGSQTGTDLKEKGGATLAKAEAGQACGPTVSCLTFDMSRLELDLPARVRGEDASVMRAARHPGSPIDPCTARRAVPPRQAAGEQARVA